MANLRCPEIAHELRDQLEASFPVLVPCERRLEVAGIGQSVGADRPQVGQPQQRAVILADVAARGRVEQLDAEADSARDDDDFLRLDVDASELGCTTQAPLLRDDEELAVGIVEKAIGHRRVCGVHVDAAAALRRGISVAGHGDESVDKIGCGLRQRQRIPAQLIRRRALVVESAHDARVLELAKRLMHRGRPDSVQPRAAVGAAGRGEGCSRELFRIEPIRGALRRVLRGGERTGQGFGREFVAEAGLVVECRALLGAGRLFALPMGGSCCHAAPT